jgi:putative oxidoreductase
MFAKLLETDNDWSLLVLRFTVGIVILPHGLQKLLGWFGGHGMTSTIESFGEWFGIPAPITLLVILAESIGALCLMLGFLSRFTAASIGVVMLGAIYFVTGRWGFFMNWYSGERGEGFEYHLLVLGIVLVLVFRGGGKWAVDRRIWAMVPGIE